MISSGNLYCNGESLGQVTEVGEVKLENIKNEVYNMDIEICGSIKCNKNLNEIFRKMFGYISQKRFRKLLYSIGYQRNQVNKIIEIEWKFKKSYNTRDVEYWRSYLDEKNRKN